MNKKVQIGQNELTYLVAESMIRNITGEATINEGGFKNAIGALAAAGIMTACGHGSFYGNQPTDPTEQTQKPYADQQYEKFDWSLITDEPNQGFIYDMYTGCANSGSRTIACIIQKDKYCWRYYIPEEMNAEIGEKYRNREPVDIRDFEAFIGWKPYDQH